MADGMRMEKPPAQRQDCQAGMAQAASLYGLGLGYPKKAKTPFQCINL
jgi:hypothetical protein